MQATPEIVEFLAQQIFVHAVAQIAESVEIFPAGRARKVDGGYVLRGSWPFSSGVDSSEWNMLASVVSSDDEADGIEYRIIKDVSTRLLSFIAGKEDVFFGVRRG